MDQNQVAMMNAFYQQQMQLMASAGAQMTNPAAMMMPAMGYPQMPMNPNMGAQGGAPNQNQMRNQLPGGQQRGGAPTNMPRP